MAVEQSMNHLHRATQIEAEVKNDIQMTLDSF